MTLAAWTSVFSALNLAAVVEWLLRQPRALGLDDASTVTPRFRRFRATARGANVLVLAVALAAAARGAEKVATAAVALAGVGVLFVVVGALRYRRKDAAAAPSDFVVPLSDRPRARDLVSRPLQALQVALASAGVLLALQLRGARPEPPSAVPVSWQLAVLLTVNALIPWLIAAVSSKERWALAPAAPGMAERLQLDRRRGMVRLAEQLMILVNAGLIAQVLSVAVPAPASKIAAAVVLGMIPATLACAAVSGGSLVRVQKALDALAAPELGTRRSAWRWGVFYYAPEDPALFVPKRIGIGTTVNFGRPAAWIFLGGLLAFIAIQLWISGPSSR